MALTPHLDDVRWLADLLEETDWDRRRLALMLSDVPLNLDGDDDGDDGDDGDGDGDAATSGDADGGEASTGKDGADADADDDTDADVDWKRESRKHERRLKAQRASNAELQAENERLRSELEKAGKTDGDGGATGAVDEAAIEAAREEGRKEALEQADVQRRESRLEVATTRLASKSFADVDDAVHAIQRAVANGKLEQDDVFDEKGEVDEDTVRDFLKDLLKRKPHFGAAATKKDDADEDLGDADGGRGSGGGGDVDDMSVDEHLSKIRRNK